MREGRARSGTGPCCLAAAALAAVSSWPRRLPALAASQGAAARGLLAAGRAAPSPRARVRRRYEEPDDALDRLDIQDGGREVGFSKKHAHLTYEEALEQEPSFCNWVLRESQKGDASEKLMDFAQWLQEQGVSHFNDGLVGFGKHARLTYEEALEQQPGFCNWALRESQKGDASEKLMDFAQWLQEQGVSYDGLIGFGRLAGLTYEEALDQDPRFCDWVLRESQKGDASGMVMDFAQWLQERGVEVEHSER